MGHTYVLTKCVLYQQILLMQLGHESKTPTVFLTDLTQMLKEVPVPTFPTKKMCLFVPGPLHTDIQRDDIQRSSKHNTCSVVTGFSKTVPLPQPLTEVLVLHLWKPKCFYWELNEAVERELSWTGLLSSGTLTVLDHWPPSERPVEPVCTPLFSRNCPAAAAPHQLCSWLTHGRILIGQMAFGSPKKHLMPSLIPLCLLLTVSREICWN